MSWVLNPDSVGKFCRLAGNKFQTDGVMKLNECLPEDFKLCFGILKSHSFGDCPLHDV